MADYDENDSKFRSIGELNDDFGVSSDTLDANRDTPKKSMFELNKETGVVTEASRKYANLALSSADKLKLVQSHFLDKQATIEDYEDAELISLADADSGKLRLADGRVVDFRLSSGSMNYYDAADTKQVLDNADRKSSLARQKQYAHVAELVGKPVTELTDEDFANVKRYQLQQTIGSLTNPDYKFSPYDKNTVYEDTKLDTGVKLKIKADRVDNNGRLLVDALNPNTGRSLGFDTASNPFLNARFDVYDWIDTPQNRRRLEAYEHQHETLADTFFRVRGYDNDSRFGEDIDMAQSAFYQMAARALQHIPGADKEYWSKVADSETGQKWADLWAGVSKKTRDDFAANTQRISKMIESGDYTGATLEAFSNIDRFLAESAPQMGLMVAGGIATRGLTLLGKAGQALVAAIPAGIDKALTDAEDFKKNNKREMTPAEFARTLAITTATLVPEQLLLGMFGGKAKNLLTQAVNATLGKTTTKAATTTTGKILADFGKTTGIASATEFGQEGLETATDNWLSEDQSKHKGLYEDIARHLTSTETKTAALIGSVMGGTLAAAGGSVAVPIHIRSNARTKATIDALHKDYTTKTITGSDADADISSKAIEDAKAVSIDNTATPEAKIKAINDLHQKSLGTGLSEEAVAEYQKKEHELARELVHSLDNITDEKARRQQQDAFLKAVGMTRESFFEQEVYFSNYNAKSLFKQGKLATQTTREDTKKALLKEAEALGISEQDALKTIDEVTSEVRTGPKGYHTYVAKLEALAKIINDANLTEGEKLDAKKDYAGTLYNLVGLAGNQQAKLIDFVASLERIAREETRNDRVNYRSGDGSYLIDGNDLANNGKTRANVEAIINSVSNDIKGMQATLRSILNKNDEISAVLKQVIDTYNKSEARKNTRARQYTTEEMVDSLLTRYRNAITTIQSKAKANFTDQSSNETANSIVGKLERLIYPTTKSKVATEFTQVIRNYLDSHNTDEIKAEIERRYPKNQDKRQALLDKLDSIQKLNDTNKEEVKTRDTAKDSIYVDIKAAIAKYTPEVIRKLTLKDIDKVNSILSDTNSLRRRLHEVTDESKRDTDLLIRLRNIQLDVQQRMHDLAEEERKKVEAQKAKEAETTDSQSMPIPSEENQTNPSNMTSDTSEEVSSENANIQSIPNEKSEVSEETQGKSPVQNLLDPELNKSVTLTVDSPVRFNLNNELRASKNPQSIIATDSTAYDSEFTTAKYGKKLSPKQIFEKIKLVITQDTKSTNDKNETKPITSPYSFLKNNINKTSPHFRLLYNITKFREASNKPYQLEFEYNEVVAKAIDFSVKEFMSSRQYGDLYKADTLPDERIARIFNRNEAEITPKELRELRSFIKQYGVPRGHMADMLGIQILQNLGITPNTATGTYGYYERVASGLGLFALRYAEELGVLTNSDFDKAKDAENYESIEYAHISCVQVIPENKALIDRIAQDFNDSKDAKGNVASKGIISQIKPDESTRIDKGIRWNTRTKLPEHVYVKHTDELLEVPPSAKETLQALHNQEYALNMELLDLVIANRAAIAQKLGAKSDEEIENMYYSNRVGAESANKSIDEQLTDLINAKEEYEKRRHWVGKGAISKGEGGIFFDWFMSRNGRFFIDSTGLNPQTNKFQRFICLPKAVHKDFDPNNAEHRELEAFAIAQAFDNVKQSNEDILKMADRVNALSLEELEQIQKDLLDPAMSEKAFGKKYKEIGLDGVENLAQCLVVLQHLQNKKKANGKVFKTWLAVENDSTTSGYAIRFANMPLTDMYPLMAKTGILVGDTLNKYGVKEIHELKSLADFNDLYEDSAKGISEEIDVLKDATIATDRFKAYLSKERIVDENDNISNALTNLWSIAYDALPKAKKDENGNFTISKALRTLMKAPTMVFGYGGGIRGISENMAYEIMDEFVQTYVDVYREGSLDKYLEKHPEIKDDAEKLANLTAIVKTLDSLKYKSNDGYSSLYDALTHTDLNRIRVNIGGRSMNIEEVFYNLIRPTYGTAVNDLFSHRFEGYVFINDVMSQAFITMFDFFNDEFNSQMTDKVGQDGSISIKDRQNLIKSLKYLWPSMPTGYGNTDADGLMLLMKTKKLSGKTLAELSELSQVQDLYVKDGVLQSESAYANLRQFTKTARAGAVVPIHWTDGTIMSNVLKAYLSQGITPVHDAWVMSALDAKDVTKKANETIMQVNADYDILGTIYNRFFNVLKDRIQHSYPNEDLSEIQNMAALLASKNPNIQKFLSTPIKDGKGKVKQKTVNAKGRSFRVNVTLKDYISDLWNAYSKIQAYRDAFLKAHKACGNVDGSADTVAVINEPEVFDSESREVVEATESKQSDAYSSSYRGYQTDGMIKDTMQKMVSDVNARADFVEDLHNMSVRDDNLTCSQKHLERLKDIIRKVNPVQLTKLVVELAKDGSLLRGKSNEGGLLVNGDKFTIKLAMDNRTDTVDPITRQSVYSSMSMAEIYSHEVIHAGLHFAFTQHAKNNVKFNSEIQQLINLQIAAKDVITVEDFMPLNYDSSLESLYREHAQKTWDYIFGTNSNTKSLEALKEFCAYGLTNERVVNKLSQVKIPEKTPKFANLADKLLHIVKGIFDLVFKNKSLSEVFPLANTIVKNGASLRSRSIYEDLEALAYKMSNADAKAARSLMSQLSKPLEYVCKTAKSVMTFGNKYVGGAIDYVTNIADKKKWNRVSKYAQKIGGSRWDDVKLVGTSLAMFLVSGQRRRVLKQWLTEVLNLSQQGTIMSIINDVTESDMQSMRLELISMLYRTVDSAAKSLEAISYRELANKFGGKLNELQEDSLTKVALWTDLQSLLDENTNIDEVVKLVTDDTARQTAIAQYETQLRKNKHSNWIINQAKGLALFMVTGLGNTNQNLNAYNIAQGRFSSEKIQTTDEERIAIDKLSTLYALNMVESGYRTVFGSLSKEGLDYYLSSHKEFVRSTIEGVTLDDGTVVHTVDQLHSVKGYTKSLFDTSYEIEIGFVKDKKDFEDRGYKLVKTLPANSITDTAEQAIYRRNFANPVRRDGVATKITGAHAIGTTLRDSAYTVASDIDPLGATVKPNDLWESFYANASANGNKVEKTLHTRELSLKELRKLSTGYVPIVSPTSSAPSDYRITMTNEDKINILGMDTRGLTVLSKMYASQHMKAKAPIVNKAITEFLVQNMKMNMDNHHRDMNTGVKYVKLEPMSANKYLRDAWNIVPKEMLEAASELKEGLWIREDWLHNLFGVQNFTVNELLPEKSLATTKRSLSMAEYAIKTITYLAKRNIVLLIPKVLLGNIVSNANYSIMNGTNPVKVASYTLSNFRAIRDYIDTKKSLERIKFRERIGKATSNEISSKNLLQSKLEHNRVHPLMEKGMYQAIIEDINPDELESIGQVMKFIKNWKIADKVPAPIKWILKNLYMTEGTFIYDFMFTLTQYSDFVARATEYQLRLEDIEKVAPRYLKDGQENPAWRDKEEELTATIVRAFINYDKPQSRAEQYLNDMGLLMFTKFAKRIQSVITRQITKNPMGVMMFLATQSAFMDTEDIMEQNFINKHYSALVHTPWDNFTTAVVPMPIQYLTGMRKFNIDF